MAWTGIGLAWQILLSIALLLATTVGLAWFAGRIYRVGILMYGKKPTIPEIFRWVRYSPGKAPAPATPSARPVKISATTSGVRTDADP